MVFKQSLFALVAVQLVNFTIADSRVKASGAICSDGLFGELIPALANNPSAQAFCTSAYPINCTSGTEKRAMSARENIIASIVPRITRSDYVGTSPLVTTTSRKAIADERGSALPKLRDHASSIMSNLCACLETVEACVSVTSKATSTTSSTSTISTSTITYSNTTNFANATSTTNTTVLTNATTSGQDSHIKTDKNGYISSNNVAVVFHDSQIIGSIQIGNATNQTCSDYASSVQAPYFSLTASNKCQALSGFVTTFEDVKGYTFGQYQSTKSIMPSTSPSTSPISSSNTNTTSSNSSTPALPTCEGYFLVSNSQNLWCMQSNFNFGGENGVLSEYPVYDLSFCRDVCDVGYAGSCLAIDYYDTGECYWLAGTASGGSSADGVTAGFKSPSGSWANHPPACNSTLYVSPEGASWASQCDFSFNGTDTNVLGTKDSIASLYSCTEYCDLAYPGISVAVDFYRIASDVGPAGRCICLNDISTRGGGPYLGLDAAMSRTHSTTATCNSPGYLDAQENYWTLQCNSAFGELEASLLETRNNLQSIQSCVDYCDLIYGQEVGAVNFASSGTCDCFANTSNGGSPSNGSDTAILASVPGGTRNQDGCGQCDSNNYFRFCNTLPVFGDSDLVGIRKSETYSNQVCSDYAKSLNATYFGLGPDYVCSAFSSHNQLASTPVLGYTFARGC